MLKNKNLTVLAQRERNIKDCDNIGMVLSNLNYLNNY